MYHQKMVANTLRGNRNLSKRQKLLDAVRLVRQEVIKELKTGKFVKEIERFQLEEAVKSLDTTEKYLLSYLQVDKYYGK